MMSIPAHESRSNTTLHRHIAQVHRYSSPETKVDRFVTHKSISNNPHVISMRTSNSQKSFAYRGTKVWNDLDSETKLASSIQCFKLRLKNYMGL